MQVCVAPHSTIETGAIKDRYFDKQQQGEENEKLGELRTQRSVFKTNKIGSVMGENEEEDIQ